MTDAQVPLEPLSLDLAKAHLRAVPDEDEALVVALIASARDYAERDTGLILTARQVVETAPALCRWIDLASWPVRDIVSIDHLDAIGAVQTLDPATWTASLLRRPVRIRPGATGWLPQGPLCSPLTITVDAGYATPDDVPSGVKAALLMMVGHLYANREAVVAGDRAGAIEMPLGVDALLGQHRLVRI